MPSYNEIRDKLMTGDIVLFSGKGTLSATIKWATRGKWSHVGIVHRLDGWDIVLLWESAPPIPKTSREENEEWEPGVRIVALSERIARYDGEVTVCHLMVQRTKQMLEGLRDLRHEIKGRPYETSTIQLIKAAYDGPFGRNTEDLSSLFCSELVAAAYQRMGILSDRLPSNEYVPSDFSSEMTDRLELLQGATLSPEVLVTPN